MWNTIKQMKWYWFIPIVWLFQIRKMSDWTFIDTDEVEMRRRIMIVDLLMFPTIIALVLLISLTGIFK